MKDKTKKRRESFVLKYLLTISASTVAEFVTFPLDITKTRLQIQGQLASASSKNITSKATSQANYHGHSSSGHHLKRTAYRGMLRTMLGIVREEGLFKLWRGVSPAILRHTVYSGCRMTFYEFIRENIFKRDKNGHYPLWKAIPTGMIAGAGGQFLASPTDLIKIRLQMEGRRILDGHKPRYTGAADAFKSIVRSDGVLGLWKGWVPNCQRAAIVCLGDLTTYDTAKQAILKHTRLEDNSITHALSSGCSGLVSATLGTPADVMKTRMMNQPYQDGRGVLYRSTLDCLLQTVKGEGFWALYKGFLPTWSRMAPWSLTFWLVFEQIRVLSGVGTF